MATFKAASIARGGSVASTTLTTTGITGSTDVTTLIGAAGVVLLVDVDIVARKAELQGLVTRLLAKLYATKYPPA